MSTLGTVTDQFSSSLVATQKLRTQLRNLVSDILRGKQKPYFLNHVARRLVPRADQTAQQRKLTLFNKAAYQRQGRGHAKRWWVRPWWQQGRTSANSKHPKTGNFAWNICGKVAKEAPRIMLQRQMTILPASTALTYFLDVFQATERLTTDASATAVFSGFPPKAGKTYFSVFVRFMLPEENLTNFSQLISLQKTPQKTPDFGWKVTSCTTKSVERMCNHTLHTQARLLRRQTRQTRGA